MTSKNRSPIRFAVNLRLLIIGLGCLVALAAFLTFVFKQSQGLALKAGFIYQDRQIKAWDGVPSPDRLLKTLKSYENKPI